MQGYVDSSHLCVVVHTELAAGSEHEATEVCLWHKVVDQRDGPFREAKKNKRAWNKTSECSPKDIGGMGGKKCRDETRRDEMNKTIDRPWLSTGVACPSWRPVLVLICSCLYRWYSRRATHSLSRDASHTFTPPMAKRRAIIDSDDDQDNNQLSPSSAKRSRIDRNDQRSSRSKGKGKAKEDNDILNDIPVDDDDDIAAIRDAHAEDDEGSQERFEEEHEESIRESIRQRNKQQGVCSSPCPVLLQL